MLFKVLARWLVLSWLLLAGCGASLAAVPAVSAGVLDLQAWDFNRDGVVALDGQWRFDWARFADPATPPGGPASTVGVPGAWNGFPVAGGTAGAHGFGTYRLNVRCGWQGGLALQLPVQHSAVRWYVNGKAVAQQGTPAITAGGSAAAQTQQIVELGDLACPLDIVAHVSNYDIRRGGLVRSVTLGTQAAVRDEREQGIVRDVFVIGGLVFMGGLPLLFFLSRRKDRSPLYFGLFCLVVAFGMGAAGTRVLQPVLAPLGWDGYLTVVLIAWFSSVMFFCLFLYSLYPQEFGRRAARAVLVWAGVPSAVVLLTPATVFSHLLPVLQAGAAAALVWMVVTLVRALRAGRRSPGLLLAGLAVLALTAAHDTLRFEHLQRIAWLPYGLLFFVLAPALMLARRFSRALGAEELRAIEQGERADLLLRSTKAGLLDWDATTGRVAYSERYREMLGLPADDAQRLPPFNDLIHPEERGQVHGEFMAQLRDRSVRSGVHPYRALEYRMQRADGEYIWVHAEGMGICGADGRTLRFICSFIDISERKRGEIELSNRVKFINDLVDSLPLGIALRDEDGRYLVVNRTWERYIGLSRDSVIGTSLRDVSDPAAAATLALDREALSRGPRTVMPAIDYEYQGRRYMQTRSVMVDAQGERIGVLVTSLDITGKHATEQALALERERLRLLVSATKAGFGDWDAVSNTVTYTGRFKEMLGYPADADTSGWPNIFEMMHPDDEARARDEFRDMIRRREGPGEQEPGKPMSYRLRRTDGSYIWIHAEGISKVDEEGRTRRFITSYLDVTPFREQEEALRAQVELTRTEQRRLDLVVRGARVGMVDWDGKTHETYYSPRFREIRGYAPDADTAGWPDYFQVMIHPDDRERVLRRWVPFIKGKGPEGPHGEFYSPEEYRLSRADGGHVWVQVSGMAVRNERGFVVRWIAAIIDISERHAQAEQLAQQNEALKENVRLREEVERIGRHDLKTPLNSIVAVPRLLREERKLGPEADELLGIVERAGYRILSMVNLSLDLYKMEQGSYVFRPDAVDLANLVDKVIADVRMHAASKQVTLRVADADAPFAWAEELLCYSLVANLMKNAVEASPVGSTVTISARAGEARDEGGTVQLSIHNRGAVPAAVRGSFFQKYMTVGKASGTGLGTYSARLMARVQDGDIAMHTSEEGGTTLTVTLRAAPEGAVPATLRHAAERGGVEPLVITALAPRHVLLVDDDEYNLLIVRRFLPTPPFTVATAINGRVALAAAELQWPDVIFMDLDMPVMGGLEAVGKLREMQRAMLGPRCTMVALSSHEDDETQRKALAAGFDRYLTKPVTRDVIHETLLEMDQLIGEGDAVVPVKPALAAAEPAIDEAVLVDPDVEAVLPEFLASRRELIGAMELAMTTGNRGEVRRIAHQMAGSFGLYGFHWASGRSRWIEANFSDVAPQHLMDLAAQLREHVDTVQVRFGQTP